MKAKVKNSGKWIAAIAMIAVLMLGLTACASNNQQESTAESSSSAASQSAPETPQADSTTSDGDFGKTVVVYFTGTGNTEKVAAFIAEDTAGSTFQITPDDPYTMEDLNWTTEGSRVNREHEDESLRNIQLTTTEVPDWDSYDTVFIGYPIWWGIAAWPVDSFVSANDFTGKTVIPFCTSTSSSIGQSGELLAELAGTGDWLEGHRFSQVATAADVSQWLETL